MCAWVPAWGPSPSRNAWGLASPGPRSLWRGSFGTRPKEVSGAPANDPPLPLPPRYSYVTNFAAGVLVVNVTWRGKTYVGTLLDCTRHDWAPPRFCDSPTSDLDARTPKGRGKRGRAAANATPGNDLSNFTETRSSVHSKLRNGGAKGRRGAQGSPAASPSPALSLIHI